jgi:hypothetical protein
MALKCFVENCNKDLAQATTEAFPTQDIGDGIMVDLQRGIVKFVNKAEIEEARSKHDPKIGIADSGEDDDFLENLKPISNTLN